MLTCNFATTWAEDTDFLIGEFSSSVVIKRRTVDYDSASIATSSWANVTSDAVRGIQHPLSRRSIRELIALQIIATDGFIFMSDVDIEVADRIYPTATMTVAFQEAHYKVVHITQYKGHLTVNTVRVYGLK